MTYCAGWKYKDAIYLIADSAVTKSSRPHSTHSSFGQLHAEVRDEHVEEGLLKLVPLGYGTVAAFAGDVGLATQCLDFLRDNISAEKSIIALLESLMINLGPFSGDRQVEILLATSTNAGDSELLHWNTVQGTTPTRSDYYQIGSLTSFHAALTPMLISQLAAGDIDSDRMLPVAVAIVQSYGVHDDLIAQNIGGLIFGVTTQAGVVTWQQDTNFVLYDPNFTFRAFVTAIARDDTLVLSSSITNDTRVFGHSTSMLVPNLWTAEWLQAAKSTLDSGRSPIWIFISTIERVVTLVFRTNLDAESSYVCMTNLGEDNFDLALSPGLMDILCQPLQNGNDESLPFRLNVRID